MIDTPRAPEPPEATQSRSPESASMPTAKPRRRWLPWLLGGVAVLVLVGLVGGAVVWSLSRKQTSTIDPALTRSAFASAMRKAGVTTDFQGSAVALTSVRASGAHPFSATFTADELAALLNKFTHAASVSGSQISMRDVRLQLAGGDSLRLEANVDVGGSTYGGSATAPITFADGRVASSGATAATAEGVPLNSGQRARLTGALVGYANAYLTAAPGLRIASAKVAADGITVSGVAPDRISLP